MSLKLEVTRRNISKFLLTVSVLPLAASSASGDETYPNRVIRILVPWAPGAITDVTARLIANQWTTALGQPVIIENRAGASGTIGHQAVAQAPADGYTVLMGTNSTYAIAPNILPSLPYDNETAFTPIGLVIRSPQALCVHPSVPAKTVGEFLSYVRSKPADTLNFGSAGIGASSHLAMELFMSMTGIRMLHVPYKGGAPAQQGLIGGETNITFVDAAIATASSESGLLRILAVSSSERMQLAPNIPTIAETVPGFQSSTDVAMFVKAGTPEPIVKKLSTAMIEATKSPSVTGPLLKTGVVMVGGTTEAFKSYYAEESKKWRDLIKARNIKMP